VLAALAEGGRRSGGQYIARCPVHADRHPSLAIRETPDGVVLIHCHAGCAIQDVLDALDLELADLFPDGE
jgi:hypothetical protein